MYVGFTTVFADPDSREFLERHIIGHEAPMLIHEVTPAVRYGGTVGDLANTLTHAHPTLNEVVMNACKNVPESAP